MVPHETVEHAIHAALELGHDEDRTIAISSVNDPQKGEALVLLSTIDIDQSSLRHKLNEAGVPNLWVPRTIVRVEKIPVFATGKLDLQACSEIAARAHQTHSEGRPAIAPA
jgi:acyl-[acyl-carrier-protein]-phospholipid O-acyltransferase/long-chain-fatty-acid--[acyl-carrier-protein] ligase